MRVLVLGAAGMLGHKLFQLLGSWLECYGYIRERDAAGGLPPLLQESSVVIADDLTAAGVTARLLDQTAPGVVVNCVGIVKQRVEAHDSVASIEVNSLLPHRLFRECAARGVHLIHLSTDCVFSGDRGDYTEKDRPDADDLYGRSKLLGEVTAPGALTIRTSMIGRELRGVQGLLEWFVAQRGRRIKGFRRAVFSGLTTLELAGVVRALILDHPGLDGLYHVASEPISKCDLLCLARDALRVDVEIVPDDEVIYDRSLDGSAFRRATRYIAPSWREMLQALREDPTPYDEWRKVQ